jgi:uncharacterized OB-fold protein
MNVEAQICPKCEAMYMNGHDHCQRCGTPLIIDKIEVDGPAADTLTRMQQVKSNLKKLLAASSR